MYFDMANSFSDQSFYPGTKLNDIQTRNVFPANIFLYFCSQRNVARENFGISSHLKFSPELNGMGIHLTVGHFRGQMWDQTVNSTQEQLDLDGSNLHWSDHKFHSIA